MSQDHASLPDSEIAIENREWIESLDYVYANQGPERVLELLRLLQVRAQENGVEAHFSANTPYINTIPVSRQPAFPRQPGDRTAHQEHHPLERHGHGGARQP
jgi:pyruvate dehydrogenase E1 component